MSASVVKPKASSNNKPTCIPIAGFKDVYDLPSVEKALQELPASANEALRAVYEKMLRLGGQRFTVKPSALPEMDALFDELPNFTGVLEDIRKQIGRASCRERVEMAGVGVSLTREDAGGGRG